MNIRWFWQKISRILIWEFSCFLARLFIFTFVEIYRAILHRWSGKYTVMLQVTKQRVQCTCIKQKGLSSSLKTIRCICSQGWCQKHFSINQLYQVHLVQIQSKSWWFSKRAVDKLFFPGVGCSNTHYHYNTGPLEIKAKGVSTKFLMLWNGKNISVLFIIVWCRMHMDTHIHPITKICICNLELCVHWRSAQRADNPDIIGGKVEIWIF